MQSIEVIVLSGPNMRRLQWGIGSPAAHGKEDNSIGYFSNCRPCAGSNGKYFWTADTADNEM